MIDGCFSELPIAFEHTEEVGSFPAHHTDPFDRLIVATARVEDLTVVTSDDRFGRYDVPVVDARK